MRRTKRDAWAGNLMELLEDTPRTDAPMHLPTPNPPQSPWTVHPAGWKPPPPTPAAASVAARRLESADGSSSSSSRAHCSAGVCDADGQAMSVKQINKIKMFAGINHEPVPDLTTMTYDSANSWLGKRWSAFLSAESDSTSRRLQQHFHPASKMEMFVPQPMPLNLTVFDTCEAKQAVQHFSTDEHVAPHHERIFLGGLPCLPDHCHVHMGMDVIKVCTAPGSPGCCLSAGEYSERLQAPTAIVAWCNATDSRQLWTAAKNGQLCLEGLSEKQRCLAPPTEGAPPTLGEKLPAEKQVAAARSWVVGEHSLEWTVGGKVDAKGNACLGATKTQ